LKTISRRRYANPVGAVGDAVLLATSGHLTASPDRQGLIVQVVGDPGHESYLVRWPDGRLSYLSPTTVRLVPAATPRPAG
jgi:hypothetical protein